MPHLLFYANLTIENYTRENKLKVELKNKIKVLRAEKDLSQADLADVVNVSRQTISAIEKGQFNPSAKVAALICLALDKKFEEVFYFEIVEGENE